MRIGIRREEECISTQQDLKSLLAAFPGTCNSGYCDCESNESASVLSPFVPISPFGISDSPRNRYRQLNTGNYNPQDKNVSTNLFDAPLRASWQRPSKFAMFAKEVSSSYQRKLSCNRSTHAARNGTRSECRNSVSSANAMLFIIYQTRGVHTGGTVALQLLYERVKELGYPVVLCNDTNHKDVVQNESGDTQAAICSNPPDTSIILSGEWCNEVLKDYGAENFQVR